MLDPDKSFIQKPFTLDLLTQKVREALSSPAVSAADPLPRRAA